MKINNETIICIKGKFYWKKKRRRRDVFNFEKVKNRKT